MSDRFTILSSSNKNGDLVVSLQDTRTGVEYDVQLDFAESTASTVAWFVGGALQPMSAINEADKLAAEMWAASCRELEQAYWEAA